MYWSEPIENDGQKYFWIMKEKEDELGCIYMIRN